MDWLDIKEFIKDTFKYIVLIIAIIFIIVYVATFSQVVGPSMESSFKDGDIILVDKLYYRFFDVNRGDIISFKYADTKYLIKRVIGLPGDTINISNNKLYINGTLYTEKYVSNTNYDDYDLNTTIPDGYYFVLGDNRENSLDSRDEKVGLISKKDIIGKIRLRIWPINKVKLIK